jgi:hypothetical protein
MEADGAGYLCRPLLYCKPAKDSECALQFWSGHSDSISEVPVAAPELSARPNGKTNQCHTRVNDSDVTIAVAKEEI